MAPNLKTKIVGIRPGEKIHELMCPNEYHHLTLEFKNHYKIIPSPNADDKKKDFLTDNSGEKGKKYPQTLSIVQVLTKIFYLLNKSIK